MLLDVNRKFKVRKFLKTFHCVYAGQLDEFGVNISLRITVKLSKNNHCKVVVLR